MPSSQRRQALGLLLLLLALTGTLAAPRGNVLCVGENGHVAIETSLEAMLCGIPHRDGNSLGASPVEACSDTDLVETALRSSVDIDLVAPAAVASSTSVLEPRTTAPAPALSHGPRFPCPTLRAQRTIVLRV